MPKSEFHIAEWSSWAQAPGPPDHWLTKHEGGLGGYYKIGLHGLVFWKFGNTY